MKLEDYKDLLVNQDLRQLDTELSWYESIKSFMKSKNYEFSHNIEEGKRTKNTIIVDELGEFSYWVVKYPKSKYYSEKIIFSLKEYCGDRDYKTTSFESLLYYSFLLMLKSYDEYLLSSHRLSWDKEKLIKAINKKWDKYFIELEKSLDKICGSPLEEVLLNNWSDKWQQSRATVFGGPEGKAILWTTQSGGYNIQQEHIRMFCKPLTINHIKEWGITFND